MVYSTIGIPMTLTLLTSIVNQILIPLQSLINLLERFSCIRCQCILKSFIFLSILFTFLFLVTVFGPALIFFFIEDNWTFLDCLYFCFISTTTIGLGDFVAGENVDQPWKSVYKIFISLYLFVGILTAMLVLRIHQEIPHLTFTPNFTGHSTIHFYCEG